MKHDTFELGAWFKGRVYEELCDLSHDGNLFVYSAFKVIRVGDKTFDSFTAISRVPWLRALVIWPQTTTYCGGGRFWGNRCLSQRAFGDPLAPLPDTFRLIQAEAPYHRSENLVDGADWSGFDHQGRIIFTTGGKLFRRIGKRDRELADFTALTPSPQPPPEWACRLL